MVIAAAAPTREAGAQTRVPGAALPALPYWWPLPRTPDTGGIPLGWYDDIDGTVVGAGARRSVGRATVWAAIGFGLKGDGGLPAALEIAAEGRNGSLAFRHLHGRNALTARSPWFALADSVQVSVGATAIWLDDARYLETIPLFECPVTAPAAPCSEVEVSHAWGGEPDHSLDLGVRWSRPDGGSRLTASVSAGVRALGGETEYVRVEGEWRRKRRFGRFEAHTRLGAGWASDGTPGHRRFFLNGADALERWLNPLLETRGAVFEDVPYFVAGGAHLRAYDDIRPLVRRYVSIAGAVSRERRLDSGFWGRVSAFAEGAWTPGLPDRLGPDRLRPGDAFLFDWRELPAGVGAPLGRFRARVLEVSELWADAGLSATAGFRNVGVRVSLPVWASQPAFADASFLDDEKKAVAARWTLSILVRPTGGR